VVFAFWEGGEEGVQGGETHFGVVGGGTADSEGGDVGVVSVSRCNVLVFARDV
jgi:hypothetical protein